jgi:hypothetical protein
VNEYRITWADGAAFLAALDGDRYLFRGALSGARAGDHIAVDLEFLDSARTFRHHARVAEIEPGPPPMVVLELAPDEPEVRELILCHARGESVPYLSRRVERFPIDAPVEVQVGLFWRRGVALELAELGMFVAMAQPPTSERVVVRLDGFEIAGRVIYRQGGERAGFAMEFVFADFADEVRVRRAVRAALQSTKRS